MRSSFVVGLGALALCASALGCGAGAAEDLDEDFGPMVAEGAEDTLSGTMKTVRTIAYGDVVAEKHYPSSPKFHAFKFRGEKGDSVQAWVTSTDARPRAWLLDAQKNIVDRATLGEGSAFLEKKLTKAGTYYVAFRDASSDGGRFQVELQGQRSFFACSIDADCVAVAAVKCCPNGENVAVNVDQKDAYLATRRTLLCPRTVCPLGFFLDQRVAQCNTQKQECEMIAAEDIVCGGLSINPHACPDDYHCVGDGLALDKPGQCVLEN